MKHLAIALGILASSAMALAEPRKVTLDYQRGDAAQSCPDERWIRQAVATRLGMDPFVAESNLHVEARIIRSGPALAGTLVLTNQDGVRLGRRELASATGDCLELASAMELAIAIAVDPLLLTRPAAKPAPTAPAPAPEPAPAEPAPVPAPAAPAPAPAPSVPLSARTGLGLFTRVGLSPAPSAGASLRLALGLSRFSVEISGQADLASTVHLRGGDVTSRVLLGQLAPCARVGRFDLCAVLSAGALQVTGELSAAVQHQSSPLLLAGARGQAAFAFDSLSLRPFLDLEAVLTRTTVLSGTEPVWVTAPLSLSLGAAVDFDLL